MLKWVQTDYGHHQRAPAVTQVGTMQDISAEYRGLNENHKQGNVHFWLCYGQQKNQSPT